MTENPLVLYIVSDSIGETAEQVAKQLLDSLKPEIMSFEDFLYNRKVQLDEIIEEAKEENAIIVFTMVVNGLRAHLEKQQRKWYRSH